MPILEDVVTDKCPPHIAPVRTEPKGYKGVTVDQSIVDRSTLTTFLEGQAWAVDYFSRVVNNDSSLSGLQLGLNAAYQQYRVIRGFEFKVTSPLTTTQGEVNKEMSLEGSSNVYSVLIPNEGDMFIADVGDGREGLFQITSSVRKTIYAATAHEISYKMVSYMQASIAEDMADKTVETLYFDREMMRDGFTPLIHEADVKTIQNLEAHNARLLTVYFADFYSREHNTFIVPNQTVPTYDPYLTKFLTNILTARDHPSMRHVKVLNVENDQAMYEMTLWNCLETLDYGLLPLVAQEMGIVPVKHFFSTPMFNSIYYSRVKAVIYPEQYQTNVDAGYTTIAHKQSSKFKEGSLRFRELKRSLLNTNLIMDTASGPFAPEDGLPSKDIVSVTTDSYYIFTEAFYCYESTEGKLTVLENLIRKALRDEPIDINVLDHLCTIAPMWDNVDRFYYIPMLLLLLRIYKRGL
jgi:hypothetical protein